MSEERMRQQEEMKFKEGEFRQVEEDLKKKAEAWIKDAVQERMQAVGVDEAEVRKQVQHEADQWIQWNLEQRKEGKPGTESPNEGTKKREAAKIDTPW